LMFLEILKKRFSKSIKSKKVKLTNIKHAQSIHYILFV
jgi:hypothetical protein